MFERNQNRQAERYGRFQDRKSRSYLKKFKKTDGWHIKWDEIPKDVEVYALALLDTNEIQGLIGLKDDKDADAVYIHLNFFRVDTKTI